MTRESSVAILDPLRRLINRQRGSALGDTQLLENFVSRRDEASFEVLVWRHGAMVLALCRRVLRDSHAAEDAFQATFLVLARKAASIGQRESVACWLYKVAYRVALRIRATMKKLPTSGEPTDEILAREPSDDVEWRDLRPVLDDEIARLPEKYRAAFILCYLEGRTNEEAAAQLGCPKGTILSRLARGRERLRERLSRRGLALTAVSFALALSRNAASAAVPSALVHSTTTAAIPFAVGTAAAELVPPHIAALTEGALHTMTTAYLKASAAAILALVLVGTAITWAARGGGTNAPAGPAPFVALAAPLEAIPQERVRPAQPAQPVRRPGLAGKVVAVAKDGKSFTMEVPPTVRSEEASKVVVKFGEKATVTYHGVGPNAAKPTEGYAAAVRFEDGSKEVAAEVNFTGAEGGMRDAQTAGTVAEIGQDGKSITLQLQRIRGEPDVKTDPIKLDDKTVFVFNNVGPGAAKITKGLQARVWYANDGRTAGMVQLSGPNDPSRRNAKGPDMSGKVLAVAKDGKSLTLELTPTARGEAAKKIDLKLADKATVLFSNVGLDGAKISEGQQAQVWLEDGSKDAVTRLSLTGAVQLRSATITGKVVAVAKDGSAVTIEQPPTPRSTEPKRVEIKLTERTKIAYNGVGPDEAKLAEGLQASVRVQDGSKDTAAQVTFTKPGERGR